MCSSYYTIEEMNRKSRLLISIKFKRYRWIIDRLFTYVFVYVHMFAQCVRITYDLIERSVLMVYVCILTPTSTSSFVFVSVGFCDFILIYLIPDF